MLTKADHWLGWLGDQPGRAVRDRIEELLAQQVEVAKVEWLKITEEPKFLTGGMPLADDPGRAQVVRTGLVVEFGLSVVQLDGRRDVLTGVFSLAVARMDEPAAREQSWLDLGETIDQVGPLLEERLLPRLKTSGQARRTTWESACPASAELWVGRLCRSNAA